MATTKAQVDRWELRTIYISRDNYMEGKPFTGRLQFANKQGEEIAFNIPKDKMQAIIQLVCSSSIEQAKKMGIELARALPDVLTMTGLPPMEKKSEENTVLDGDKEDFNTLPF